ncbi:MAG: AI-2E family transporter [Mediterranea massiliensis]|nr:AI-2E family transporter [Mediterranea massiliensis]
MKEKKITFDRFIRGTLLCALIVGTVMLLNQLSSVLLPFFVAWLIAYLLYPLVTLFQYRLKLKSRILSIFCAILLITLIGVAIFYLLIPPIIDEFGRLKDLSTQYLSQKSDSGNIPASLSDFIHNHIDREFVNNLLSNNGLAEAIKQTITPLWGIISGSLSLLMSIFTIFIILLYVVFILLDYESIAEGWIPLVPEKYRKFIVGLRNDVVDSMNRYFRGQAFVAFCVGILFCIGFLIIDFPMAIGFGLFIGALNLVPYLQIIAILPTILLAMLKAADTGGNFWLILLAAMAVFAVVQTIQDGFIVPRVMGKITGLNPAIILLSLSIWGSLLGMLGMIIALPLTTLMLSYYQRFIINREDIYNPKPQPKESENEGKTDE